MKVNTDFTGSITAVADFNPEAQYKVITFDYDHNGLRTRKTVKYRGVTETYDYTLHGKLITHMTKRTEDEEGNVSSQELHFFYDSQSKPAFVEFEGERYRYVHSLQGDIIAIVDSVGNTVVEYKYDAWGKPTSTDCVANSIIGDINPFRYRGYGWDEEVGLYYLRSRYYSSHQTRFVSIDSIVSDGLCALNLYAYCQNNPVARADAAGLEGYYVVLNVYDADSWNRNYGHYDLSIISKDNHEMGWTFSYGPIIPENYDQSKFSKSDEFDARVDVYKSPKREGKDTRIRFVLFDDFSEEELSAFKEWFYSAMEPISQSKGEKFQRCKVKGGFYSKYNISKLSYCGSGLVYLVANMGDRISRSKNTQTGLYKFLDCILKVSDTVITMLSDFFTKYTAG